MSMHYDSSDDIFKIFISIIGLLALGIAVIAFSNSNERTKCASLNKQGVKAYMVDSLLGVECVVIQRDIRINP